MNEKDFIKIDIEKIEPVELFDWEKKNIEKSIFRSTKKLSNKKIKWMSAIAIITLIFTSSAIWLPAVANRIPIVLQLMQSNNNPQLQVFSDYATIINQIDESNGSSIELAEAFLMGILYRLVMK
ncbi:DUF4179 domain-containing protein [Psychrobacillus sp. NEAU-3TGS]|uniref:DUF4179 domain-containing protein n=1 Tax=Psychrobacillus sp. NEAU-3TGS TaxID=2995412 RepID=UPI00249827BC|nr:DUF4179 domain-containing protein [Psychrobacillus sp. NEAU-3TGS]MDI2587422.1 DUF4179 domain-containing protein [Psychrobacillus sp. NEAU-3TGS]